MCLHLRKELNRELYNPARLRLTWVIAELLLKYGGYGNNFFLLADPRNPSSPTYVISLQELIRQWKPLNEEALLSLLQLIDKDIPSSFRSRLKKWRNTRQRSSETSFDPAQYKPFHLSMLRPSQDSGKYMYDLYSVWSAGCETKVQGLRLGSTRSYGIMVDGTSSPSYFP